MCGIAGIVGPSATSDVAEEMALALAHRGPDGAGLWQAKGVALGHRRLSIVDLAGGSQPMVSASGRWVLIFNGEIYNYQNLRHTCYADYAYRTMCDTEVILAGLELEGEAALPRLVGMFAIAAWDRQEQRLLLARDGQGIKPLYYAQDGSSALFASEIGALQAGGLQLRTDKVSLETFLDLRFVPPPRTMFEAVRKLPPGHFVHVAADGSLDAAQPFAFHAPRIARSIRRAPARQKVLDALLQAVSRQMMADVPVGILLSGGVNSAVVAAAAKRSGQSVSTFCVGYADSHASNELDEARRSAELLGTDHQELTISSQDVVAAMPRLIRHLEEPVVTTSLFSFYLLCEEVARHRKVVLTGQGADEPWAGYGRHRVCRLLPLLRPLAPLFNSNLLSLVISHDDAERVRKVLGARTEIARWRTLNAIFSDTERAALTSCRANDTDALLAGYLPFLPENGTDFERLLAFEVRSSLPENLLMLADKLSMAHSLEVRVPLLDSDYLSTVEMLPQHLRRGLWTAGSAKLLHKEVCKILLPAEIVQRPKKGFQTPFETWMRGELGEHLLAMVCDSNSFTRRHLSIDAVRDLIGAHVRGRRGNLERQLFAIWTLEEWHRAFPDAETLLSTDGGAQGAHPSLRAAGE